MQDKNYVAGSKLRVWAIRLQQESLEAHKRARASQNDIEHTTLRVRALRTLHQSPYFAVSRKIQRNLRDSRETRFRF